jgi:hypothetical protein
MRTRFAVGLFVVLFVAVGGMWAGIVPITNPSFELPAQTPPGPVLFAPTGWTVTGSPDGAFLPPAGTWPSLPQGTQAGYSNGQIVSQILTTDIAPNTTYTLSVWVSTRTTTGDVFNPTIELLDGSTPIITMTTSTPGLPMPVFVPPDGTNGYYTWVDWVGTYTSGPTVDGDPLEISLGASAAQSDFDEVSLYTGTPEPAMFALVGAGLLGLVTRRRFAK